MQIRKEQFAHLGKIWTRGGEARSGELAARAAREAAELEAFEAPLAEARAAAAALAAELRAAQVSLLFAAKVYFEMRVIVK